MEDVSNLFFSAVHRGVEDVIRARGILTFAGSADEDPAIRAIRTLRARGLQHRIALVGFDDVTLGDQLDPGITVIAQDPYAIGHRAAELLLSRLGGFDGPSRHLVVDTRLIVRGSGELRPAPSAP